MKRLGYLLFAFVLLGLTATLGAAQVAQATHGGAHATFVYWDVGVGDPTMPAFQGFDPHETLADKPGITNQPVGKPTMVTAMENACGGNCGIMYWNPDTNDFKTICVTGGLDFAVDVNTSGTLGTGSAPGFGGGDAWSAVHFNFAFSPWVNFRGSDNFRAYNTGTGDATGVRVDPSTGKVYMGSFNGGLAFSGGPGQIVELDPATNTVRKWTIRNHPYFLAISGKFVYATAISNGPDPDQIVRLDPNATTSNITRWNVPGPSPNFRPFVGPGNPNYISVDPTSPGKLWFTETRSNEVANLNTGNDTFQEYTKPGVHEPQAVANSGSQAFFTEEGDPTAIPNTRGFVSVLAAGKATPVTTTVTPITETVPAVTSVATFFDGVGVTRRATIPPKMFDSECIDPSGIDRCPVPTDTLNPTGMTGVAFPNTVLGSMEGSEHVFKLTSEELIEPEANTPGKATGGGKIEGDVVLEPAVVKLTMPPSVGSQATFGFVVQLKTPTSNIQGELQYDDHDASVKIHVKDWDRFVITQPSLKCGALPNTSHAHMEGTGDVNGTMQLVTVDVDDCDEPGSQIPGVSSVGPDQFQIDTAGYMNGGPLIGGNIQITLFPTT